MLAHSRRASRQPGRRREDYDRELLSQGGYTIMQWAAMHDLAVEAFDIVRMQVIATRRFPRTAGIKVSYAPDRIAFFESVDAYLFGYRLLDLTLAR